MINNKIIKIIFIFFLFLSNFSILYAASQSDGVNINLNINNCNFDTICDPVEDFPSCPSDCLPICNFDTICDVGEDITQCPSDCTPPICNNNSICDGIEDINNCPGDCTPICNNNNICEVGEDISNCPADCTPICNNNNICEVGEDTLNCPSDCVIVPPASSGSSGGYVTGKYFENLTIDVGYTNAVIKWKSIIPTISNLKWGTTFDYRDGSLRNVNFLSNHEIKINNLKDGTLYYFTIQSENKLGGSISLNNQSFKTLSLPDITPTNNPSNVKAVSNNSGIIISWTNPEENDFDYIRVMKNKNRYYGDPNIGDLVYEGRGNYFTDSNVIEGSKYYYSLFARDKSSNYSSGALVSKIHNPYKKISLEIPEKEIIKVPEKIIDKYPEIKEEKTLSNIYKISQDLSTHDFKIGDIFDLSGDRPINVSTNYLSSTHDDDIWVEIRNSKRETINQYFFSKSKDKDGFRSVSVPSFEKEGYYSIAIYRYFDGVAQIVNQGAFNITKIDIEDVNGFSWYSIGFIVFIIFILTFSSWFLVIFYRKIRKNS